jgi:II/X family phage/plasmid replication protein
MIDWVSAKIPFHYPGIISDGEVVSVTRDGEVEYAVRKRLSIRGSHDGAITLRTIEVDADGNTVLAELSGNPVKFLQGHNLFGSDDLLNLVAETVLRLAEILKAPQPDQSFKMVRSGNYTLSRIDINRMFALGSRAEVLAYLYAMSTNARTRSQGPVTKGTTVYLNKTSKRWSFKFYSKAQEAELKRNRKQGTLDIPTNLKEWVDAMLRAELTLKSNELRELNLHVAANWHTIETLDLFADYAERIEMAAQKPIDDISDLIQKISTKAAVSSYQLWRDGHDPRQMLPKNTFYRHRRALLEHGIDISMPAPPRDETQSNVVPLCKTLELKPATMPHWVSGTEYLFEPRKLCAVG